MRGTMKSKRVIEDSDEDNESCSNLEVLVAESEGEEGSEENEIPQVKRKRNNKQPKAFSNEEKRKYQRFSCSLLDRACTGGWEPQEIARLFLLVIEELQLSHRKTMKLLVKSSSLNPAIISTLGDEGIRFSADEILSMVRSQTEDNAEFIDSIGQYLDEDVFNLNDEETIQAVSNLKYILQFFVLMANQLHEVAANNMSFREKLSYARKLCSFGDKKKICGKILRVFVQNMQSTEAAGFIHDVICYEFFLDLKGKLKSFLKQFDVDTRELVKVLLKDSENLNTEGEIVDSDEDENGNLRDFVVNSGEEDDEDDDLNDDDL